MIVIMVFLHSNRAPNEVYEKVYARKCSSRIKHYGTPNQRKDLKDIGKGEVPLLEKIHYRSKVGRVYGREWSG